MDTPTLYLFKRAADSQWIFGENSDCECSSGKYRIVPSSDRTTVTIYEYGIENYIYYNVPFGNFKNEAGAAYASFAALKAGYAGFFFSVGGVSSLDTELATDYFYLKSEINALPVKSHFLEGLQLLGSGIKALPFGVDLYSFLNGTMTLVDGDVQEVILKVEKAISVTGVGHVSNIQGVFTGDNENAIALYSISEGAYTQIAKTANNANIWKGTAGAKVETAFTSPVTLQPGMYALALIYNNSAQTTAPKIYIHSTSNLRAELVLGNSMKLSGKIAAQTALPASTTGSAFTFDSNVAGLYLY